MDVASWGAGCRRGIRRTTISRVHGDGWFVIEDKGIEIDGVCKGVVFGIYAQMNIFGVRWIIG